MSDATAVLGATVEPEARRNGKRPPTATAHPLLLRYRALLIVSGNMTIAIAAYLLAFALRFVARTFACVVEILHRRVECAFDRRSVSS